MSGASGPSRRSGRRSEQGRLNGAAGTAGRSSPLGRCALLTGLFRTISRTRQRARTLRSEPWPAAAGAGPPPPPRSRAPERLARCQVRSPLKPEGPDIRAGRIRFPREAKRYFPTERDDVEVVLKGVRLDGRYDPRSGPDRERSAVLLVGKANLEELVQPDEVLSISISDGVVRLD